MPSKLRDAALRLDLSATIWRFSVTRDTTELDDLLPDQLRVLALRFGEGSPSYVEIHALIQKKEAQCPSNSP